MKKRISLLVVIVLTLTMALSGCGKKEEASSVKEKFVSVETEASKKQDINVKTTLSAKVKPIEEADIVPKMPGKVTKVNVEIGKKVNKGEVLFTIDQTDLVNGVKSAQAAYDIAAANLKRTQEQIQNAKINYERMKSLYEEGAIAKKDFESYELQASSTNLDAVQAQVNQARVGLENAQSKLSDATVTAPISGIITAVNINEGEMASSAQPAVSIANMNKVVIDTNVSEYLINKIKVGDVVDISIKSADKKNFQGKITALSPATASNSMTYPIKIEIDNKDSMIKPGMFANVNLVTDKKGNVITIPSEAVVIKDGESVVYTVKDNIAHVNKVETGIDNGEIVEIVKGIKPGQVIVNKGQDYLEEGSKVEIKK
ncbi:efflux RND transporter periplasmic adaptor subunit [Tepidibacter hydrothermalis]|uniref:Efflux RND transporter periplasmic adaptor subunit n=1 Tax=Tepidibacter hydrothermalis TaxID=3036126 RepID=A0ABY8EGG1_9FIRM|nr:efflux RND transporter periplasmic adaptor subunit [Tepidibacter hydrothermalis]WFD10557.1 efflux RND transporter periplasmic adaptor subunit [Tepidibacter hydrothermalis]